MCGHIFLKRFFIFEPFKVSRLGRHQIGRSLQDHVEKPDEFADCI